MRKALDYNIEMVLVVLIMAMTAPVLFNVSMKLIRSDFGGFDTQIEKTAAATTAEIIPQERDLTRDDIMLMFAIADNYVQEPHFYNINGTTISVDAMFLSNRNLSLITAFGAMPDNAPKKITLYSGATGPRYWKIENK